jgi:glycerol-3-phosphate cytidylyltransferase-like family protein
MRYNNKKQVLSADVIISSMGAYSFLIKAAAIYGKIIVSVGKDDNYNNLKGRKPYFSEQEKTFYT